MTLLTNSVQYGAIYYDDKSNSVYFEKYHEPNEVGMIPVTLIPMILVAIITALMYVANLNSFLICICNIAFCTLVYSFYRIYITNKSKMIHQNCNKISIYELTEEQLLRLEDAVSSGVHLMFISIKRYIWTMYFLPILFFLATILKKENIELAVFSSVLILEIAICCSLEMQNKRRKMILKKVENFHETHNTKS